MKTYKIFNSGNKQMDSLTNNDGIQHYDLHMHTTISDGENTPEEMILSAIDKGLSAVGISDHSASLFDKGIGTGQKSESEYKAEILRLKEKYQDKIKVFCNIELDFYSDMPKEKYDYIIGSVHSIRINRDECKETDVKTPALDEFYKEYNARGDFSKFYYIPVDANAEIIKEAADKFFEGDIYKLTDAYYDTVGKVYLKTGCRIIGHFDLISKFNEGDVLFDSKDARYINSYKKAADALVQNPVFFEINTGAISRGYRNAPYPAPDIYEYIKSRGGDFLYSSDAHKAENIAFGFDTYYV